MSFLLCCNFGRIMKRSEGRMDLVFCLLGLLPLWSCSVSGDLTLFPVGREVEYNFEAEIVTGTVLPTELGSTWKLSALLVIQQQSDDITIFQVVNITTPGEAYNADALMLPFQATYKTGELTRLIIDPKDEMWSLNIKKALVSLFQLKLDSIASPAFISQEIGLFGSCRVEYVVTNPTEDTLIVGKVIYHDSCTKFPQRKSSRVSVFNCPNNYQDMISSDSERQFTLTPMDEVLIKNITATGRILVQPYQAKSEAHYSKISQLVEFRSIKSIDKKVVLPLDAKDVELTYQKIILDPTYGKAPANKTDLINEINNLLGELTDSLSTWEVGVKGLDNQTSFYILDLMRWLDVEDWDKLFSAVELGTSYRQETIQHFFWELVPQVGSEPAALFIKDLVRTGRVKGQLAGRLLVNFPFFLTDPSENLLTQFEELLQLDKNVGQDVKNSVVLGFASLIHKTCVSNCITDTIDRYAKLYLDKFTESTTYEDKMLYLQGLSNMELNQALEFFMPIITGQTTSNRHIRFLAIWATLHTVNTTPNKIFEVYWPIFSNKSESLDVRVSAFTLLVSSNPSPARFFSLYWFMQSEQSELLYNFYYTTIQSLSSTSYPCYYQLGKAAAKLVRFVPPKSKHWTTGNYILDFEDRERDYGGLLQVLLIASEFNGLPNVFIFMAEQHALGQTRHYSILDRSMSSPLSGGTILLQYRESTLLNIVEMPDAFSIHQRENACSVNKYEDKCSWHDYKFLNRKMLCPKLYLKVEGLYAALNDELQNISRKDDGNDNIHKVLQLLLKLEVPLKVPENLHLELIIKIDGKVVISYYANQTSFNNWKLDIKRLSSMYFEFSVNFQSLYFPSLLSIWRPTDLGTPILVQIRSTDLISARGSISQENGGYTRNAELDLRYSWNGISTLKSYNPFNNNWQGAERCRNLHIRLPFATQLIVQADNAAYKVTAVRHRGFVAGSRLGMVWHASSRLISHTPVKKFYPNISDEWTMDSEDLGARLGASVFDCSNPDTLPDALHLLKGAFLANNKNYQMIPGGVVLLGLLSMRDNLRIIPTGSNCGVMLYFSPLLTQVEPVIQFDGTHLSLKMTRQDGLLWEIKVGFKKLQDSNEELTFKLYHAPSVSVTAGHTWRVIQLEGAFIVPSRMSGVFNPPAAVTGYSFVSWGDAAPSNADKASMLDLKVTPGGRNDTKFLVCTDYTPRCLQAASDLAARQTATLQYANLPAWLKMAAHALFPEHIQTEGTHTQVTFAYPVALLPWNTKGLCAINKNSVLTLDNATLSIESTDCYSLAVADCSHQAQFSILVKSASSLIVSKIFCGTEEVELFSENGIIKVQINGNLLNNVRQGYHHIENNKSQLTVRMRAEGVIEVELRSGVVLQHYNTTIVILIPGKFRGYTCGVCGDFNGDTNNEPAVPFVKC